MFQPISFASLIYLILSLIFIASLDEVAASRPTNCWGNRHCRDTNSHRNRYQQSTKHRSSHTEIPSSIEIENDDDFLQDIGEQKEYSLPLHRGGGNASEYLPRGGASYMPAGWHPFGYGITDVGIQFLEFDGSRDSDVGRFLASLKSGRKKKSALREQWLEIVRVAKTGQSMRILRKLDEFIEFCLKAGFIN